MGLKGRTDVIGADKLITRTVVVILSSKPSIDVLRTTAIMSKR